jgi:hypothetical protein
VSILAATELLVVLGSLEFESGSVLGVGSAIASGRRVHRRTVAQEGVSFKNRSCDSVCWRASFHPVFPCGPPKRRP